MSLKLDPELHDLVLESYRAILALLRLLCLTCPRSCWPVLIISVSRLTPEQSRLHLNTYPSPLVHLICGSQRLRGPVSIFSSAMLRVDRDCHGKVLREALAVPQQETISFILLDGLFAACDDLLVSHTRPSK